MKSFFVFDVESIGLHGEGFAVGGCIFLENGAIQEGFCFCCPTSECQGSDDGRIWVRENVPMPAITHRGPRSMRTDFWMIWLAARADGAIMAADCGWPVEARFLAQCIDDAAEARESNGPYPFFEISTALMLAGMDPLANYPRTESENPKHNPYADAVQSARLLAEALAKIRVAEPHPLP
jgi:hypothetical protein